MHLAAIASLPQIHPSPLLKNGGWGRFKVLPARNAAVLLALSVGLIAAGHARADIYAYTDEGGVTHFSNVPDNQRYQLYMRTEKPAAATPLVADSGKAVLNLANQRRYGPYVTEAARANQVEAALVHAVISAESGYNPNALSRKGAAGLMQLMPDTARRYGVTNPYDPAQNIDGGARYLRYLMQLFNNDLRLALAAYNAGEQNVIKYGYRVPPYRETVLYVPKVMRFYQKYRTSLR
jgi:soluble lytic murein transglycosylase-like protein